MSTVKGSFAASKYEPIFPATAIQHKFAAVQDSGTFGSLYGDSRYPHWFTRRGLFWFWIRILWILDPLNMGHHPGEIQSHHVR